MAMTLDEIKSSRELFLTPEDVSEVLKSNAHAIRLQAHDDPRLLGFRVVVIGTRTKIPRRPFLEFIGEA